MISNMSLRGTDTRSFEEGWLKAKVGFAGNPEEIIMGFKQALVVPAIIAALAGSALANGHGDRSRERGGWVPPCSLDGVNPVHHPEIFGNPAAAASYGFVYAGGAWRVRPDCHR